MIKKKIVGQIFNTDLNRILNGSADSFKKLDQSRILIIGATGFIGTWLTSSLMYAQQVLDLNFQVVLVTRNKLNAIRKFNLSSDMPVDIVETDFRNLNSNLISKNFIPSHMIFAGTSTKLGNFKVNETSSISSIEFMLNLAHKNQNIPHILNLSSGAIYGSDLSKDTPKMELPLEKIGLISRSDYGELKYKIEKLLYDNFNANLITLSSPRLFAFYGPHLDLDANFAIGNFLRNLLRQENIQVFGNNLTKRSYLHITDLIKSLIYLLAHPTSFPINIGGINTITMEMLANLFKSFNKDIIIEFLGESLSPNYYYPDISNMASIFGEIETMNFANGIEDWISWQNQ